LALADIQRRRYLEKTIQEYLQRGYYPRPDILQGHLREWAKNNLPGRPVTFAPNVAKSSVSSAEEYNRFFQAVEEDLNCLYEQARDILERLRAGFDILYNQEQYLRTRLETRFSSLEDDFSTFERIDLQKTTALVDLRAKEVRLDEVVSVSTRFDLEGAIFAFQVLSSYVTYETLSPLESMADGDKDTYWLVRVQAATPDSVAARLTVDLGTPIEANKIEVVFHGRPPSVKLSVSEDGSSWQLCPTISPGTWFFAPGKVRWLRVDMEKLPDSGRYDYYFGIRELAVYHTDFVNQGELVTVPFNIYAPIVSSISLSAEVERPPLTDVKFYVDLGESGLWLPIEKELVLSNIPREEVGFSGYEPYNTVYVLKPGLAVDKVWLPELYLGVNKYLKGRTYAQLSAPPSLEDWRAISENSKVYVHYDKDTFLNTATYPNVSDNSKTDNFFYYAFCIEVPENEEKWVDFNLADGYSFAVYLNNKRVPVMGVRALLHLIKGWNRIVFLVYNSDPAKQNNQALTWNWSLADVNVLASAEAVELVSYPELISRPPTMNRYALVRVDGTWCPAINYDPQNYLLGPADFILSYQKPNISFDTIRLKAVLTRAPGAGRVTPRLKSYKINLN